MDYTRFHKRKFRIAVFPKKEFYSLEKSLKLLHKRKFLVIQFLKKEILSWGIQKLPKSDYTKFYKRKFLITEFHLHIDNLSQILKL